MKNIFNLNRILLLLRADWTEYRTKFIYFVGATIVGVLVYFLLVSEANDHGDLIRKQSIAFTFGTIGTLINYCKYVGNKIHKPKGLFLTLPANAIEKYTVLLFEGIMLLFIFTLTLWAGLPAISLITDIPLIWPQEIWRSGYLLLYSFIFSLFFLSYITFRKHAATITIACIATTIGLFVGLIFLIRYLVITYLGSDYQLPEYIQDIARSIFCFLKDYHTYLLSALNLFVFYLAYLKFKRKELR